MRHYNCAWHHNKQTACPNRATQIIIFGCLNQHTDESLFCHNHLNEWINQFISQTGFGCLTCHQTLAEYQTNPLTNIKNDPKFQLKHAKLWK